MNETALVTRLDWEGPLEEAYDAAVESWRALPPGEEAVRFYRECVFPLTCERFRREREGAEPLELLYVSVGTQPYAPTLAVLANPARCVALLETEKSAPFARQVEDALAGETGSLFLHKRIHEFGVADISLAIRDIFDSRALPSGSAVGADVTGGTKVMTAALAGVGSLYGWRMFYIAGQYERGHHGLSHHERVVVLDNVLEVFGARRREQALALLAAGACRAAELAFLVLAEESAASVRDQRCASLAAAAGALRSGKPRRLARHLGEALKVLESRAPSTVHALVRGAAEGPPSLLEPGPPSPDRAALAWLGARTCRLEGSPPAARALAEGCARLLGLDTPPPGQCLRDILRELQEHPELRLRRRDLRWLDRHLGAALADRLEGVW